MPSGCRFFDRCEFATDQCKKKPDLYTTSIGTKVRCWLYEENEVGGELSMGSPLLEVKHLKKYFPVKGSRSGHLKAVDDVSFCK